MLLEHFYDTDLAQGSYMIGCQVDNTAIVVDPRRDIQEYLDKAKEEGMTIVGVAETHIHADYLSGTRELAKATGAKMYVSDEGGPDWTYGDGFDEAVRMKHGHQISLGNITIEAVHTPGHTPEHMSYLITDGAQASEPGFMLTGDFVFVGDLGRPDLLDEAAGGVDTRFQGAKDLFASLKKHFVNLPDYVQVLPSHGAGSACGKALGAIPTSTVGYEKHFSWWPGYVLNDDEEGFVKELLEAQPDAHAYFGRMKVENREGPEILGPLQPLKEFTAEQLLEGIKAGTHLFVDTRSVDEIHAGTVENSLAIPRFGQSAIHIGWAYDPNTESRELVLLADDQETAAQYRDHFIRVGVDALTGYITSMDGLPTVKPKVISVDEVDEYDRVQLLDVRNKTEYAEGHIPGADQLSAGRVMWNQQELPSAGGSILTYCQSGVRNVVAASAMRLAGYDVVEIDGSYSAWAAAGKPTEVSAS